MTSLPKTTDVLLVAGARPNFVKIAPLHRALVSQGRVAHLLLHTGQHHDFEMSKVFFDELEIPDPDAHLGPSSGSHAAQTSRIMTAFELFLEQVQPRVIVVVGDVNSTLACSLVAAKACIPVAHVEAGLRSFDRTMPEEINRVVTDALSDILYTTCDDGTRNLLQEGASREKIHQEGNVMIDTLLRYRSRAEGLTGVIPTHLAGCDYALATIHRPSNVDRPEDLAKVVEILSDTGKNIPVIFPAHPRTQKSLGRFGGIDGLRGAGVELIEPQSYLRFMHLLIRAKLVLTDSGGIQEETTVLGVPCLTLRPNTERPVTEELGTNRVVGLNRRLINQLVDRTLRGESDEYSVPVGWDGHAAERIAAHLADWLS